MKIFLINSPSPHQRVIRDMAGGLGFDGSETILLPPLDLAYMAATLESKGHHIRIIDADAEGLAAASICQDVTLENPDIVILTVSLPTIYHDCQFARTLKDEGIRKVIVKTGISYPSLVQEILTLSAADLCINGECDIEIDTIITGMNTRGTARISADGLLLGERAVVADLDQLPLPARHLLPNHTYRYVLLGNQVTTMQTSRGCPFPCSFYCAYPLVQGRVWRARSVDHVLSEIDDIVARHDLHKILFRDATFTFDRERILDICDRIIQEAYPIKWWCETRVDRLDVDLMKRMHEAGCLGMNIGVETGDEEIRQHRAKTGLTSNKLTIIRQAASKIGLRLHFLLMIGLPDETKQSLHCTYELINSLKPSSFGVCTITPYPGTELYELAKKKGWIETEDWSKYGGHYPVMHTDHLTAEDLLTAQKLLYRKFLLLNKGRLGAIAAKYLDRQFRKWVFS